MMFGESFENVELSPYKWATHMDKLEAIARGEDVFPVTVELDLVSYCNHSCGWCVDPEHTSYSLERTFISKLLGELDSLGIGGIVFKGGGEGTLHPSYAEILEETRAESEDKLYKLALYNKRPKTSKTDKTYLYGEYPDMTINHEGIHVLRPLSINEFDQLLEEIKNYKK